MAKINIYRIEKFTIADKWESGKPTPVQVGDIIKIVSMEEFDANGVEFKNKELQKRIASSFVRVIGIKDCGGDLWQYFCKEVTGRKLPVEIIDSDIEYVLRGDNFLFRTEDGKVHTAEPYGLNDCGITKVTIDETTTIEVENELDTTISKAEIKSKAQPLFSSKITHVQYGI